jgi:hypothetical protein
MSTAYEIPLQAKAQTLSVILNGTTHNMTVVWNDNAQCWVLDVDDVNGADVLSGIPLIGNTDLLSQFEYLGLKGKLIAQTDHDPAIPPTFENLGSTGHLYFVPT